MRTWKPRSLEFFLMLGLFSSAMAQTTHTALPYPTEKTPMAIDRGALTADTTPLSITIALRLRDLDAAESLLKALHTPGHPEFHQFLTAQQFVARLEGHCGSRKIRTDRSTHDGYHAQSNWPAGRHGACLLRQLA
jgi:Pro-kumamolisin, activation domain